MCETGIACYLLPRMNRRAPLLYLLLICLPGELFAAPEPTAAGLLWRYGTGGAIPSRPAVSSDGTVYAISEDGYLYALSPSGDLRWRCNLGWIVTDCLAVGADGTVYAGLQNDELVAVNPRGEEIWRVRLDGRPVGDPITTPEGRIYLATSKDLLYELSHTGEVLWRRRLPSPVIAPLVMDGSGTLYVAGADRRLSALSPAGATLWSRGFQSDPGAPAVGPDGALLVGTRGGGLYRLTPSGHVLWRAKAAGEPFPPLAAGEEVLRAPGGSGAPAGGGMVTGAEAVQPSGAPSRSGGGAPLALRPTEHGVAWIVATHSGEISALSRGGALLWRSHLAPLLDGDYFLGRGMIVVLTGTGDLVLLDYRGAVEERLAIGTRGGGVVTAGGRLYVGGRDWILSAIGLPAEAALDGSSPWPETGHDPAHTGRSPSSDGEVDRVRDPFLLYLEGLLARDTQESLSRALAEVKKRFIQGTLESSTDRVVPFLERIAGSGTLYATIENNRVTNDYPLLRAEAADLLGYLGTLGTRDLLIRIIGGESDPFALAAEIRALGRLGSDPGGGTLRAIVKGFVRSEAVSANEQVADAAVVAIGRIAAYEGELTDPSAAAALDSILLGDYSADIRMRAAQLLEKSVK